MDPQSQLGQTVDGFTRDVVDTVREPLLVLGTDLHVKFANRAFYQIFQTSAEDTETRLVYALGDGQWDIPTLRERLQAIIPGDGILEDFQVEHDFPGVGRRVMLLNARKLFRPGNHTELLVLAMEDVTERRRVEADLAARYGREHRLAEALQKSLLLMPPADAFPGLSVATRYEAASDEALVGGDFCDAFTLDGGQVALIVGDVMGKGLPAAIHTAKVKYALRAFLREYPSPAQALGRLNAFLCDVARWDDAGRDTLVVLAVVVLDPTTGRAAVSVAGLEPPLLLRADGRTEEVTMTGLPLGIAPKAEYMVTQRQLAPGDALLLATDGLTEARSGGEFLGYAGLTRLAAEALASGTVDGMCQTIMDGARAFAGGVFRDDACLLLARLQ